MHIFLGSAPPNIGYVWNCANEVLSFVHSDYKDARRALRVVSIGEKPYYDPKSVSRRQALNLSFATPKASL